MGQAQKASHSDFALELPDRNSQAMPSLLKPQWLLGLMLLALHVALAWGISSWWSRAFLLSHLGLFLLWQPLWRGERHLGARDTVLLVFVGLALLVWGSWWLLAVWLSVLFALIGGNVPGTRHKRQGLVALAAATYLLAMLLAWVVPHLFPNESISAAVELLIRYGLLLPILFILVVRVELERESARHAVDLFYSLLLFFLVAALVLGSFVVKQLSAENYAIALAQTLFAIALMLVILSWLWNPRAGFAGIGTLMSRYLLSVGMPFEHWMRDLAHIADREADPEKFLERAVTEMNHMPWIAGVRWQTSATSGEVGERSSHEKQFSFRGLTLTIFTRWSFSPALLLHLKLLSRLLRDFYSAKQREQIQRDNAYTQAIYETGARLTHDVKNLLQSLRSLCGAVEGAKPEEADALRALMQRQLPQITQRLQGTLDKLTAPERAGEAQLDSAASWWIALKQRFTGQAVSFVDGDNLERTKIPVELFDSVAENLIQNALSKRKLENALTISVAFTCASGPCLRVSDTGSIVGEMVAKKLFDAPVPSKTGLGVGLYQAARQAGELEYRLRLATNKTGEVSFELSSDGKT